MSDDPASAAGAEAALLARLSTGDEAAFSELVDRYHQPLVRLALAFVGDRSVAEEVVQDSWIGVLKGLAKFEGRSSLKTWIFRILTNRAKTRGAREARTVSFSALGQDDDDPAVDPDRFTRRGSWSDPPRPLHPEKQVLDREMVACAQEEIDRLPPNQRTVITLRDVEGLESAQICNILEISETNQRVLLHRARSKVRRALEQRFANGRE